MRKILFVALLGSIMSFGQNTDKIVKSVDKNVDKIGTSLNKNVEKLEKGTTTFYGDLKDGVQTIHEDAKDAVKYLTPEAKNLIVKVAQKLEKTTDQVWDILVRQQKVWSWCYLALTISAIILWYRFFTQLNILRTDVNESGETKILNVVICAGLCIAAIIASAYSSVHFVDMATGFMNPEYGAMKNIYQVYKSLY